MATEIARILRGKHRPIFAPHMDTGEFVIVINAAKVVMTAGKAGKKIQYNHSGYPGGLKERTYSDNLVDRPEEVVRTAIKGMLPKGPLGRQMITKLKVYQGAEHPHAAQSPLVLDIAHARSDKGSTNDGRPGSVGSAVNRGVTVGA